jgi:hypothetical protein
VDGVSVAAWLPGGTASGASDRAERKMMREIQRIIDAADAAYQEFIAADPGREIRDVVRNAVKFLAVDLEAAAALRRKVA